VRNAPSANGVVAYLNQGGLKWLRSDGPRTQVFGDALALGDFDGDGRTDSLMASSVMGANEIVNLAQADGSWQARAVAEVRPRAYIRGVAAADFDRNGRSDIALAYIGFEAGVKRAGIDVLLAQADGIWARAIWMATARPTWWR
jgi:hypothetical protein